MSIGSEKTLNHQPKLESCASHIIIMHCYNLMISNFDKDPLRQKTIIAYGKLEVYIKEILDVMVVFHEVMRVFREVMGVCRNCIRGAFTTFWLYDRCAISEHRSS